VASVAAAAGPHYPVAAPVNHRSNSISGISGAGKIVLLDDNDEPVDTKEPSEESEEDLGVKSRKEKELTLLQKLRNYRSVFDKTKDGLANAQNTIGEINQRMMKVDGLYKWRVTKPSLQFFGYCLAGFVVLVIVPFRFIFPFVVIDIFTAKFQRQGGTLERLLDQVPLPIDPVT